MISVITALLLPYFLHLICRLCKKLLFPGRVGVVVGVGEVTVHLKDVTYLFHMQRHVD